MDTFGSKRFHDYLFCFSLVGYVMRYETRLYM